MMSDAELFEIAREGSPSVAAWNLVDRAVENGGKDNVTVVVLDVQAIEPWRRRNNGIRSAAAQGSGPAGGEESGAPGRGPVRIERFSPRLRSFGRRIAPAPDAPPRGVRSFMKGLLGR